MPRYAEPEGSIEAWNSRTSAPAPALDESEIEDLARSAFEEAMSFGVSLDSFHRLAKHVAASLAAPAAPVLTPALPPAPPAHTTEASRLGGLWPHIGADEHGCATMEWWRGDRKLTLYLVGHPHESLLKVWGPNMSADMAWVTLMDAHAVRQAFQWLTEAPGGAVPACHATSPSRTSQPTESQIDEYLRDYTFEADEGSHTPSEFELAVIKDAIMGLANVPRDAAAALSPEQWVDQNVSGNPALMQAMKNQASAPRTPQIRAAELTAPCAGCEFPCWRSAHCGRDTKDAGNQGKS